ncbi:MAG TPA: hypothetical protein VML75_06555, partial [Kofleriaceae bacterium]|nr:hypothetical protein [Kofleriaceae bacterium]
DPTVGCWYAGQMHFACSRCAHRQSADCACDGCGNKVVQDLRDSAARRMLYEAEGRWQRKRRARYVSIGAAAGVVIFLVAFGVRIAIDPDPDNMGFSPWPMVLAVGAATSISIWLDRAFGARRKYPYLDDYE